MTTTTTTPPASCSDAAFDQIRFRCPDRSAPVDPRSIDSLLPPDHFARSFWLIACSVDLSELLEPYRARLHQPGRPPIDIRILLTLWLCATHEGIRSARKLRRLCYRDDVYRWVRGGVAVNYHTLADFRVQHGAWLHLQATAAAATLHHEGRLPLTHIGQDGLRVRAWAGSDSFKSGEALWDDLQKARMHQQRLEMAEQLAASARGERRPTKKEAAQRRGARDRVERLRRALQECELSAYRREQRKKGDGVKTRISATDPECRKMKMPDGGYRPAFNVQFATDLDALVPVGADVVNEGNDAGQSIAMRQEVVADYGAQPEAWYVDGGYATREDIQSMTEADITIYTPIKAEEKQKAKGQDPSARKKGESDEVAAWRQRMSTPAGKQEYRNRGKTEWTNAEARRHGMYQVTVRGLEKVDAIVWWYVWVMVLTRGDSLRAGVALETTLEETAVQVGPTAEPQVEKPGECEGMPEPSPEDGS
jgi:transposase